MTPKEQKLKLIFQIIKFIEILYLLTVLVIVFASKLPPTEVKTFTQFWITLSYMLLPVFLIKNIIVGVLENDLLDKREKGWLIVRCVIYITLTIYSYPLVSTLGFCY